MLLKKRGGLITFYGRGIVGSQVSLSQDEDKPTHNLSLSVLIYRFSLVWLVERPTHLLKLQQYQMLRPMSTGCSTFYSQAIITVHIVTIQAVVWRRTSGGTYSLHAQQDKDLSPET